MRVAPEAIPFSGFRGISSSERFPAGGEEKVVSGQAASRTAKQASLIGAMVIGVWLELFIAVKDWMAPKSKDQTQRRQKRKQARTYRIICTCCIGHPLDLEA